MRYRKLLDYLEILKKQFNNQMEIRQKRNGIYQLILPLYHEDGDMIDIFLEQSTNDGRIHISDHGMTLMRLSYSYDIDTENKERIFNKIISENGIYERNGTLFIDTPSESLYMYILQFAQTIGKILNMQQFKREIIQSLFFEMLEEFVVKNLAKYNPRPNTKPLPHREELEVDWELSPNSRPLFLFGVKDSSTARLATIKCQAFKLEEVKFVSFIVYEDFDIIAKRDRRLLTSAADKQYVDLEDFQENAIRDIEREVA